MQTKKSDLIVSMIEELMQRGVLSLTLKKWDAEELRVLLEFIANKIGIPKYQKVLIDTMNIVIGKINLIILI